jgi:hypothetical protein
MKKITIYFILLLFLGSTSVFAQANRSATTEKNPAAGTLVDPKLSPEEQALLLTAGEDNPAKINESAMVDPKMDTKNIPTEEDYGASNAKPAEGSDVDPRLEAEQAQKSKKAAPAPVTQPVSDSNQPAGETSGIITNYRNMSGGNDQPRGDEPKNAANYRDMHGSDDQPPGDTPNK